MFVLWAYDDVATMRAVQAAVADDPDTRASAERRRAAGLHGLPFEELTLESTGPAP